MGLWYKRCYLFLIYQPAGKLDLNSSISVPLYFSWLITAIPPDTVFDTWINIANWRPVRGPVTYSVFRHGRIMVGSDTRLHPAAGVGCFQFSPYSRFPGFANIPCRAWGHGELGPPPFPGYRPAWYIQKGNTSALQNTAYCCSIRAQGYPINYRTPRVHERPQYGGDHIRDECTV